MKLKNSHGLRIKAGTTTPTGVSVSMSPTALNIEAVNRGLNGVEGGNVIPLHSPAVPLGTNTGRVFTTRVSNPVCKQNTLCRPLSITFAVRVPNV